MRGLARVVPLLAALAGAAVGEAAWRGAVEARSTRAPPDWTLEASQVPTRLGSLVGRVRPDPEAWSLDYWGTLWPENPHLHSGPAPIFTRVRLPPDGQVELWTSLPRGANEDGGVGLILERLGEPGSAVVRRNRGQLEAVACEPPLGPPRSEAVSVRIEPLRGGVVVEIDGQRSDCKAPLGESGPALRAGLRRVQLRELEVGQIPIPSPGPGLRPLWWASGALIAAGLVGLELWLGATAALVLLTTLPLGLSPLALQVDLRSFAETARILWLPVPWLAALGPLLLATLLKLSHHLGRALVERPDPDGVLDRDWPRAAPFAAALPASLAWASSPGALGPVAAAGLGLLGLLPVALLVPLLLGRMGSARPRRAASFILALGALAACVLALMGVLHRVAPAAAGLGAVAYGGLLWANANARQVRHYNLTCLLLSLGVIASTEGALRYTAAGVAWSGRGSRTRMDDIYGWVPEATDSFDRYDKAEHTPYPDRGFPVAIPPPDGRPRLVAMGGSTTGGAFQNDDLADFYPARIAEGAGGGLQVLNQGVGGWTTWHIRRYLLDHIDSLLPDVLTLYIGHNDLLTPVPVPYAQLYAAWRQGQGNRRVSAVLGELRLYQALRYGLSALRPASRRVAVPVEDARDNLVQITDAVLARGGRVILASEGLAPDPGPLAAYNSMMQALAEDKAGVSYLDVAEILHRRNGDPLFIDDCHLTEAGHRVVAEAFLRELRRQGVVDGGSLPPGG